MNFKQLLIVIAIIGVLSVPSILISGAFKPESWCTWNGTDGYECWLALNDEPNYEHLSQIEDIRLNCIYRGYDRGYYLPGECTFLMPEEYTQNLKTH